MNFDALVIGKSEFCENNILLRIRQAQIADKAYPGQFVNIKCPGDGSLILRRPISIMNASPNEGWFEIAFEIRGKGTRLLSEVNVGDTLDIMGPLGKGFEYSYDYRRIAVIGGGIGIYPLYFLGKKMTECEIDVFMGYRCADRVVLSNDFDREGCSVYLSTDDGSAGYSGYITSLFKKVYEPGRYDMIYVCGPEIMARTVTAILGEEKSICQISMEERMGCGIGACLVCTCAVNDKGVFTRKTTCKDGPVFRASDLVWED
ncbi:MAG: dihydroorotate dehydrogenase electron transfer subunit [Clostridia bacterium]|nr:dihydroorotate dehydrogenase electron transfer subunit [Clostridia bacterium]MBN2883446.1 dihydroorotate dehydrogenase electron transfer subunit [Clostridia bacterium]